MAKLSTEKRNQLADSDFGIPEKRMYPLHDKTHVESAVKLFGHAETKYKKSLARKILSRAREYGMDTSGWKQVLTFAQEQVPPMSDGTSVGNTPPALMAPYYDEQDELLERVNDLDGAVDPFVFAKRIVSTIHDQVEKDSKPPTGNQNCQLCTWCAEAWYRNMQVLPRPVYSPRDPALEIKGETIVMNPIKKRFSSQREVVETVRGNIDSRWYVHVNWKDSTGGHEFLVINIKDYAYIMDAQAGLLKEIDESDSTHNYFRDINFKNSYMVRLDTRKFNAELFNEMNDPSKVIPWKNSIDIPYMRDHGMLAPGDDDDPRFRRVLVPSEEGLKYLKEDPELSQYWEDMHKATNGEFLVNRETGEAIGHVFVHTNKKDKGFIFNLEVTPSYRRQGYGWILIDDAVRRFEGVDLTVRCDNEPAVHLYLDYGFEIYKKGVWFDPPHEEYWMKLKKELIPKHVQEGVLEKARDMTLQPVKGFKYDKVFYGDPINGGSVRQLNGKPLFVTPHVGLASIFVGRRLIFDKLAQMGYTDVDLGYVEWRRLDLCDKPLTDVHVFVKNQPNLKPFAVALDGYLHTIDCSKLKDNIFRYPWMSDPEHEVLIAKVPEVPIDHVQKLRVIYHVRGIEGRFPGQPVQESTNVFESGHFSKYKDNVLGFNDEGMAVMKKCDCGGNISVSMKGEPVYTCESCGKTYGVVAYQEGAVQDLKNGVNPYSDKMVFHVTPEKHADGQVWKPRVPDYLDPYNPEETGFEDNTTPRICFSTSIEGCLNGITVNLPRQNPDQFDKLYVYIPEKPWKQYKHKTNKELVKDKLVYDANVTREVWIMEPVRMKLYGVIRVDQIADSKRKSVVPTSKGQKDTRNYFTYKWHWVVKPKALEKSTKFDYSPERVLSDLCVDVKKFKYGLIKDGRLQTGNVSDADYNKYWVFHSGETVDQAGGGNCYDMVEYEAGYLEAFGVPYKKYFMNFTDTKNTETLGTHTICVVPHNGKFIYIEQAFKRVVDEWGYERKKEFDKLTDIFEYVAEVSAEYHNQDVNYGVWDYTNEKIDYGTPIKNFMEWIMMKCKMVYDGEAFKSKPIKEGYEVGTEENDVFIGIGDSLFYVSEYHNALFDDPDAHEEAIREFGILLDSYDDEIIQEVSSYGPYDEYLEKHGYDPATNTIEDPNRPGKRISAGRIGSEKERRRMNRFLRDNGYDPKTETILTDIDEEIPTYKKATGNQQRDNEGNAINKDGQRIVRSVNRQKKRVKFKIDPHRGALAGSKDAEGDRYINMPPEELHRKPILSNNTLKHEEGHINQYMIRDRDKDESADDRKRMDAAQAYTSKLDRSKIEADHDLRPTEYDADAYSALHNKYEKNGSGAMSNLMKDASDFRRKISRFEKSIDRTAREQGVRSDAPEYQEKQNIDFLLKHSDHPGSDANDLEWAEYLKRTHSDSSMFDKYIQYEDKKLELDKLKKKRRAELREISSKYGGDSDEYIDAADKWQAERKSYERELEKIGTSPEYGKAMDMIEDLSDMSDLTYEQLKKRDQQATERAVNFTKSYLRNKAAFRNPDEKEYAHQKRGEFAQQQWEARDNKQKADEAKRRQLAKEQLKQQIASGKLSGDQAAKAERKIQRIEAFEKKQAENAQAVQQSQPPKTTSQTQPQPKAQDTISIGAQDATKPTVKKEGYYMDRFGNRFYTEAKKEEMLSDDMEDISIGDLNLEEDDEENEETTSKKKSSDNDDDDDEINEEKITIKDESIDDTDYSDEGDDDPMGLPEYLRDRMSEDDLESYDQPDENLNADNVDLGQFGKDTSDVQNEYDPKEVTILMKLMASEADAMNEYMDGAKETNMDVLRRLYADIANEERFHMEQLLYAKCELTGEKYEPKDPEVKSEYEELLKMGMDEETAMQTAVDRCHIRGSMSEDDKDARLEIQADVETLESSILMFDALYNSTKMVMESKSSTPEDVDKAYNVFVEAVYSATAAETEKSPLATGNKWGPIKLLAETIKFLIRTLMTLLRKFVEFIKRIKNHSAEIRRFIKQNGLGAIFDSKVKFYFIDLNTPNYQYINRDVDFLLGLAVDTIDACSRSLNIRLTNAKFASVPRNPKLSIKNNPQRGAELLAGTQLIKSAFVIPKDEATQEMIANSFFGFNNYALPDGKSANTLNALRIKCDLWVNFMQYVDQYIELIGRLANDHNSVYFTNKKKYDIAVDVSETVVKTCKAMISALQSDINTIIKLDNAAMEKATAEKDKQLQNNDYRYRGARSRSYERNIRRPESEGKYSRFKDNKPDNTPIA